MKQTSKDSHTFFASSLIIIIISNNYKTHLKNLNGPYNYYCNNLYIICNYNLPI